MGALPYLVGFFGFYGGMIRCAIKSASKPDPYISKRARHRRYL